MTVRGNNATPPSPAIAPGAEQIDPAAFAAELGRRTGGLGLDARIGALVPAWGASGGPFFQAGLAGYSDAAMRIVARRQGCPFCVTEALLDRALLAGGRGFDKADLESLRDNIPGGDEDHPTAGQIIGSDPDEMAAAALKMIEQAARADREYREMAYGRGGFPRSTHVSDLEHPSCGEERDEGTVGRRHEAAEARRHVGQVNGAGARSGSVTSCLRASVPSSLPYRTFAVIDVNLACPVKKIKSKARGGHWLAEPHGAIEILRAVRAAVPPEIPCTVKLRRAYDDTPEMARNFEIIFNAAYELGYAWTTVHARTVEQKYIGPSRWPFLKDLTARHPDKLIFGSGDIWTAADIFRMLAYTGVHAVSVARGCIGNPWIFRQARQMLAGQPPLPPTIAEQRRVLEDHFTISASLNGEHLAGRMMRKFGIRFAAHHPRAEEVRQRMIAVASIADWRAVLDEFYTPDADCDPEPRASASGSEATLPSFAPSALQAQ
jgi:tRNA-dihydrouridine synthase B